MNFAEAVDSLMDSLESMGATPFTAEGLRTIAQGLAPVHRVFPTITRDTWQEIVDLSVTRFMDSFMAGQVDRNKNPGGYLVQITRNSAIDYLRREAGRSSAEPVPDVAANDDAIAASVDALAGRQAVEAGLQAAWESQDDTVVRVVLAWLQVAAEHNGAKPSTREVAAIVQLSHTAVSDAMDRFKRYLPKGSSPA